MTTMTGRTPHERADGTIRLPGDLIDRRVAETLRGQASSDRWLPEGLHDDLDDCRAEHLRLRGLLIERMGELAALKLRFIGEDGEHAEAEKQAAREGAEIIDRRTSPSTRAERIDAAERRVKAAAEVFAEAVDAAVACLRQHESTILASLREQHEEAAAKRAEAQKLLHDATVLEAQLAQVGQWVQRTADSSGSFDRQPAPDGSNVAARQLDPITVERALNRHWTREPQEVTA